MVGHLAPSAARKRKPVEMSDAISLRPSFGGSQQEALPACFHGLPTFTTFRLLVPCGESKSLASWCATLLRDRIALRFFSAICYEALGRAPGH